MPNSCHGRARRGASCVLELQDGGSVDYAAVGSFRDGGLWGGSVGDDAEVDALGYFQQFGWEEEVVGVGFLWDVDDGGMG